MKTIRASYFALATLYLLCCAIPVLSQDTPDTASELARAARSPYDIERFVETHTDFDWEPLWKALKITDQIEMAGCVKQGDAAHSCSSELIIVVGPLQAILLLRRYDWDEVDLRFIGELQPDGLTRWHFAGHFEPHVHYFQPEHRIVMFGNKPYLAVTQQGESGLGMSTELESWIDLTRSEFVPVFSYTKGGHANGYDSITRDSSGGVVWLQDQPMESITVEYRLSFTSEDNIGREVPLGSKSDKAVFTRADGGKFRVDDKLSTTSSEQIGFLYEDAYAGLSNEDFLRYDFPSLKEIASKADSPEKRWLRKFLPNCKETPEKKQLSELLQTNSMLPSPRKQSQPSKPRGNVR